MLNRNKINPDLGYQNYVFNYLINYMIGHNQLRNLVFSWQTLILHFDTEVLDLLIAKTTMTTNCASFTIIVDWKQLKDNLCMDKPDKQIRSKQYLPC
jgi:hypothetical protein